MQGFFNQFDIRLVALVHELPAWLRPVMEFATLIGQPVVVGVVLAGFGLVSWRRGHPDWAWASGGALAGLMLANILKLIFHRARPDTYVPMLVKSYSFPSGHAAATSIGYGLLAWLAARHLPQPWAAVVSGLLIALILLVGLSRVYLGAHYPTDVLGGWVLGIIVVGIIVWVSKL